MKTLDFDTAFDRLMGNEGGYVWNPRDPGGETNWGISKRSYPQVDIKNLTRDGAKDIYRRDFWERVQGYHPALVFQMFDAAVNHGIDRALKFLQGAAGVYKDGVIGPKTHDAVAAMFVPDLLMCYIAERLDFWAAIPGDEFDDGWMRRAATNLRFAAQDD